MILLARPNGPIGSTSLPAFWSLRAGVREAYGRLGKRRGISVSGRGRR